VAADSDVFEEATLLPPVNVTLIVPMRRAVAARLVELSNCDAGISLSLSAFTSGRRDQLSFALLFRKAVHFQESHRPRIKPPTRKEVAACFDLEV